MAADYILEQEVELCREAAQDSLMEEAAIHIINGKSEAAAIEYVKRIKNKRIDAELDEECIRNNEGHVDSYLDADLEVPSRDGLNQKQIYAIKKRLLDNS